MIRRALVSLLVALVASVGLAAPAVASDGPVVTGRLVTPTGAPIVKARVAIGEGIGFDDTTKTDAQGRFRLSGGGEHAELWVTIGKHEEQFPIAQKSSGVTALGDIPFSPTPTISGTFTTTANAVSLIDSSGREVVSQYLDAGVHTFDFIWATADTYTVRLTDTSSIGWVYLGDTGAFEKAAFVTLSATAPQQVAISAEKTGSIAGAVHATKKPKRGTTASLMFRRVHGSDLDVIATPATSKRFSLHAIPLGTYRVTTWNNSRSLKDTDGATRFTVSAGKKTSLGTFRLPASYFQEGWGE